MSLNASNDTESGKAITPEQVNLTPHLHDTPTKLFKHISPIDGDDRGRDVVEHYSKPRDRHLSDRRDSLQLFRQLEAPRLAISAVSVSSNGTKAKLNAVSATSNRTPRDLHDIHYAYPHIGTSDAIDIENLAPVNTNHRRAQVLCTHEYANEEGAPPPNTSHPFATAKGGKQELKCTAPPLAPVNTNHSRAQCLGTHTYTNKAGATPSNISHTFAIAKGGKQELRCTAPPLTVEWRC